MRTVKCLFLVKIFCIPWGILSDDSAAAIEIFNADKVKFFLKRTNQSEQEILIGKKLTASTFNASLDTVIFTHGYLGSHQGDAAQKIQKAYLNTHNINTILVDYVFYNSPYLRLLDFYKDIGKRVGSLVNFLVTDLGLKLPRLTLIGHSFGAHISSIAANNVNGTIERIFGLDPGGPLFRDTAPEDRLSPDDAEYVGCLHTSPVLGISDSICKVNYFMNGGQLQPGCSDKNPGDTEVLFGVCSHNIVIDYFTDIVTNSKIYPASLCMTLYDAKHGKVCARLAGQNVQLPLNNRPYLPGNYYVVV